MGGQQEIRFVFSIVSVYMYFICICKEINGEDFLGDSGWGAPEGHQAVVTLNRTVLTLHQMQIQEYTNAPPFDSLVVN